MVKKILSGLLVFTCVLSLSIGMVSAKEVSSDRLSKDEIHDLLKMYKAAFNGNVDEWDYSKANDISVSDKEVEDAYNQIYSEDNQISTRATIAFSTYFNSTKTKWVNRSDGITLSCYYKPDAIFTSLANATMVNAQKAFEQLKKKFSSSKNWKNTQSMQAQFHCHVTTVGKLKNPWNIEPWRTESNLITVIAAGCNP